MTTARKKGRQRRPSLLSRRIEQVRSLVTQAAIMLPLEDDLITPRLVAAIKVLRRIAKEER